MSIADRITSMSNNLSNAYDGIEYLGVDTSQINKNIQNLSSMLNVVYEGLPKVSDEGVSPSIEGSRVGRLKTTLKASDTTQNSTTGKSLVDFFNIGYMLLNNGTASFSNGEITVNSNTSAYGGLKFPHTELNLQPNTQYTFSATIKSTTAVEGSRISCNKLNTAGSIKYSDPATSGRVSITFTTPNDISGFNDAYALGLYPYGSNQTAVYTDLMLALGTDDTYEPYTNGASPNPDFPQSIHVVKGNNTVEVCGKNLFSSEWEQGGILNTTGANIDNNNAVRTKGYIAVQPNQHYSIQRSVATSNINVRCYDKNKNYLGTGASFIDLIYGGTSTNPMQEHTNCIISPKDGVYYLRFNDNSNNLSTQYMMVKGDFQSGLVYEPYNGTTYPINLPVQNLFDKDNANILDSVYVGTNSLGISSGAKTLYISCLPNATYTISKISSQRFIVAETQTTPARNIEISNRIADLTGTNITITTSADAKYLVVFYYLSSADTLTEQQIRDSIQIEPGNKANRYTPHGVVPIELCKTNTYQDKLFKAIVGDTVYDTLTSEQKEGLASGGWYKYEMIRKIVLDGSENWGEDTEKTLTQVFRYSIQPSTAMGSIRIWSDKFIYNQSGDTEKIASSTGRLYIAVLKTRASTAEDFKTWLSNNNVIVYYVLETPTITQITDETLISQLNALYNAISYNGQTNVLQTNADVPFTIYASALKGG